MRRRLLVLGGLALLVTLPLVAARAADPPTPDPNFAFDLAPRHCLPQPGNQYEAAQYADTKFVAVGYSRGRSPETVADIRVSAFGRTVRSIYGADCAELNG